MNDFDIDDDDFTDAEIADYLNETIDEYDTWNVNLDTLVSNLTSWDESISFSFKGFETLFEVLEVDVFQSFFSGFWTTSSTMVFHSLQDVHWPCHLENCVPQFWQKNVVFTFAINTQSLI